MRDETRDFPHDISINSNFIVQDIKENCHNNFWHHRQRESRDGKEDDMRHHLDFAQDKVAVPLMCASLLSSPEGVVEPAACHARHPIEIAPPVSSVRYLATHETSLPSSSEGFS
jgi:hypothetical protein